MAFAAPDTDLEKPQGFSAPTGDLESGFSAPKEDIANHVQNLVSDKSFDPAQYAIQTGDTETAFQARQALRNRTLGQKVGVVADTLTNPETYANAAKGVGKFAAGLVATPLHTLAQAGATVGAPIAGALGADNLQHTLENEQQTQGAEATLAGQQIEQGIRGMGRGIRNTAQDLTGTAQDDATQRAHFAAEIEAAKNNAQLAQSRPLNTGLVADLAQTATGTPNLSDVYSPEALQAQGARPVSETLTGSMAAAADPTNLLIPLAGKIPGVSTVAGGLVQGAGKVASGIGKGLGYAADAQRAFHVPILTALTHGLTGGLEAQAAKLGSQLGAKAFNFIGDALDQQGGAMRSGIPSALDQTAQQALSAGESALGTNAQRVIGNTAGNVVATALGFAPLNYALSGGDPEKFAESEVGAGAMGGVFGLAGERARMENTAQYRLAKYGAQQFTENPMWQAHQETMSRFSPADQQAINALRGTLYGGTGTDVLVLDGKNFAQQVGAIGGDARGQYASDGKTVYINADAVGNQKAGGALDTAGHETGHAVVDFLRNAGREADARAMLESIANTVPVDQVIDMVKDYHAKLLASTDLTGKSPEEVEAIRQKIAADNPTERILEENLSEITRRILSGRGISSFSLPQSTLERLTDAASRFMEARGWMPAIDPNASLGFKAQMVREAARRMRDVLYETGKRASAAAGEGDTVTQKLIKARQTLAGLPQVTPDMPASKAGAINRQRQAAEKEIADIQGSMGISAHPTSPTPTAPNVAQDGASGATPQPAAPTLNRYRIAAILRQQGLTADEARRWSSVAEGANDEMAVVDALKKRAQQKFPSTPVTGNSTPTPPKPNERPIPAPTKDEPLPTSSGGAESGNGGGVATAEPVSVPAKDVEGTGATEKEAPVVHTPEDLDAIAAKAREDFLATKQLAKAGKNKGKHTAENQRLADKAAFDAAAEAHAATLPANYQGIKQRVDAFGKKTVSGQLDPSRPFDSWLIDQAKTSKMLNDASLQTLLKFQDAIGKTITYDYGHAPVAEEGEQPTGENRAAQQAKHSVAQRLAGEAPQQIEPKTSIPLSVGFNPGSKSFTVFGASPEKLLNNFNHIAEAIGQVGEATPYRDINDPRLVADIKAVIRNHQNGWQGDGSRPAVGTAEYPNVANPGWANSPERTQIPSDRFEFVNMMLGDEGAKAGTPQAKAKAHLANENRRLVNEAGETNELRQKINDAIPWKDKNGQPASWSSVNLEDPLNENISPALADNIRESSQSDESIRQHGKVGDLGRFFEGGRTPNRAKTAAGFLPADTGAPEEGSTPGERLAREAEQAGVVLKVDQLKGLIQQDKTVMDKVRERIQQQTGKPARFMPSDDEPFFSQLTRTVQSLPQENMTVGQARAALNKGAKPAEIRQQGIFNDPLSPLYGKSSDDKVSKSDLVGYSLERQAKVQDVTLSQKGKIEKPDLEKVASEIDSAIGTFEDVFNETDERTAAASKRFDDALESALEAANSGDVEKTRQFVEAASSIENDFGDNPATSHILKMLDEGKPEDETHFSTYQLPGADEGSYREQFVTWPKSDAKFPSFDQWQKENTERLRLKFTNPVAQRAIYESEKSDAEKEHLSSTNWKDGHSQYGDVANPIVRIRRNIRTAPDGSKTYFLEEIQGPSKENQSKMPEDIQKRIYEIGMKRAIRDAVDSGADSISWTTGEQQAERYDLSKQVERINYEKNPDGTFHIEAIPKGGGQARTIGDYVEESELEQTVGKGIAEKILKYEGRDESHIYGLERTLSGLDLKVGGEGLKRLYDQTLPRIANELAKKTGAKVGTSALQLERHSPELRSSGAHTIELTDGSFGVRDQDEIPLGPEFKTKQEAEDYIDGLSGKREPVHSLEIPQEWKDKAPSFALFMPNESSETRPDFKAAARARLNPQTSTPTSKQPATPAGSAKTSTSPFPGAAQSQDDRKRDRFKQAARERIAARAA